jgi:hypothetical protein
MWYFFMMALGRMGLLHVFGVGLVGQNGASNLIGGLRSAGIENIDGCVSQVFFLLKSLKLKLAGNPFSSALVVPASLRSTVHCRSALLLLQTKLTTNSERGLRKSN